MVALLDTCTWPQLCDVWTYLTSSAWVLYLSWARFLPMNSSRDLRKFILIIHTEPGSFFHGSTSVFHRSSGIPGIISESMEMAMERWLHICPTSSGEELIHKSELLQRCYADIRRWLSGQPVQFGNINREAWKNMDSCSFLFTWDDDFKEICFGKNWQELD